MIITEDKDKIKIILEDLNKNSFTVLLIKEKKQKVKVEKHYKKYMAGDLVLCSLKSKLRIMIMRRKDVFADDELVAYIKPKCVFGKITKKIKRKNGKK